MTPKSKEGTKQMKNKIKIISLMLVLAMAMTLFSGCKGSKSKEGDDVENVSGGSWETKTGAGRFFESEVSLPKEISRIMAFKKLSDGSLEMVGEDTDNEKYYIIKSSDKGETWKKTGIEGLKEENYITKTAISPDGKAALFHYEKGGSIDVDIADTDGSTESFSFSFQKEKEADNQVWQAEYGQKGELVVRDSYGALYVVSADGTCSRAFDTKGISVNYFNIVGNTLVAVHDEGVLTFGMQDGELLEEEGILNDLIKKNKEFAAVNTDSGAPMVFSEGTKEDGIMFVNKDGIFHFTKGGSVVEQLVDGSLTSLGSGEAVFEALAVLDKENLFVAADSGNGDKLLQYSYDKKATMPDKELVVYALDDSTLLRQAAALFQKSNPDIHVNLQIGLSGEDGVTLEDALSVLNTNILAGKGPDVLILDGMPAESYIEKGILADISDVVEEVDKEDGIFANIREGSSIDGKIYAMPIRFLVSVVEGDAATVESGGSLEALAKRAEELKQKNPSSNVTPNKGTRTLLRDLYYADSASWQTEDGSIDKDALTAYLTYAKQIYDVDSKNKENDSWDKLIGDGVLQGDKLGTNNSSGMINGEYKLSFGSLAGIQELQTMTSTWAQTKADYCLMNHDNVKSYIPYLLAGVTEGGNTEAAKEFVKELLGKKAGSSELNGIPVNRAAYDKVIKEKLDAKNVKDESSVAFTAVGEDEKMYGFEYINLTQGDIDKFTEIITSLTKPAMTNRVIQELILEQGDKYLLGEQGLEDTVDAILKKVNLYLAE